MDTKNDLQADHPSFTPTTLDLLRAAQDYRARGWPVYPVYGIGESGCSCGKANCKAAGKHPAIQGGFCSASTDPDKVRDWFTKKAIRNLGIATGREAQLVVLDVDVPYGEACLKALEARFGGLPATVKVKTGKGGYHLYFSYPMALERVPSPVKPWGVGVDLRADGGAVVAPPSRHHSGSLYEWVAGHSPDDLNVAALPAAWVSELAQLAKGVPLPSSSPKASPRPLETSDEKWAKGALESAIRAIRGATQGERNQALFREAAGIFEIVNGGSLTEGEAWGALRHAAEGVGLGADEIERTLKSARKKTQGKSRTRPLPPSPSNPPVSSVETPTLNLPAPHADDPSPPPALQLPIPGLKMPPGWGIDPGVYRWSQGPAGYEQVPVAPFVMIPVGILESLEEGGQSFQLAWETGKGGKWREATIQAAETQSVPSLVALYNQKAPIGAHNAKELGKFIFLTEALNREILPHAWTSRKLGWQGKEEGHELGFLWGRHFISEGGLWEEKVPPEQWQGQWVKLCEEPGASKTVDAYRSSGTLDQWKALITSVFAFPKVTLGLYAALSVPFLGIIPEIPNVILDWSGETSRGKSTTLAVAASVWGVPTPGGLLQTWDVSGAGLEALAALTQHLPVFLDDSKRATASGRASEIAGFLYQLASGKGKVRGHPSGLRETRSWRGVVLSTGEAPITSFSTDPGAKARTLVLRGSPFGATPQGSLVAKLKTELHDMYGTAGPELLQYLAKHRSQWPDLRQAYKDRVAHWQEKAGSSLVLSRAAYTLALLEMGAWSLHKVLGVPEAQGEPLEVAWQSACAGAEETDQPAIALQSVYHWAVGHAQEFYGRHLEGMGGEERQPLRGWAGAWAKDTSGKKWDKLCFLPHILEQILKEQGQEPESILSAWAERGWLWMDGRHRTWKATVGESLARVLAIRREALQKASIIEP